MWVQKQKVGKVSLFNLLPESYPRAWHESDVLIEDCQWSSSFLNEVNIRPNHFVLKKDVEIEDNALKYEKTRTRYVDLCGVNEINGDA
jgi:hypothetical protein